ncbi:MAG: hypothetical protein Q8Q89_02510 [bacterium]|nr:hypothetical protein [bacterium]
MNPQGGEEFAVLKAYCDQLGKSLTLEKVIKARHLIEVGDHIRICGHMVTETQEKILLFTAFRYWLECRKRWSKNHPDADVDKIIPKFELKTNSFPKQETHVKHSVALAVIPRPDKPKKSWEESLTRDDEEFLKQLYSDKGSKI